MKTKIIVLVSCVTIALGLFSFKSNSNDSSSKVATVAMFDRGGDDKGFRVTYSDGTVETKSFNVDKTKPKDVVLQLQITTIANELKEKGFHLAGHITLTNSFGYMIFEKD